jgi:hypothetical protein
MALGGTLHLRDSEAHEAPSHATCGCTIPRGTGRGLGAELFTFVAVTPLAHATCGCTVPRGTGRSPGAEFLNFVAVRPARRRHTPHVDARFHVEQDMASVRTSPPSWR